MLASEIYQQVMGKKWRNGLMGMLDLLEEAGIDPVRTYRNGRGRSVEIATADEAKFVAFLQAAQHCNEKSSNPAAGNDRLLMELVAVAREIAATLQRIENLWRT